MSKRQYIDYFHDMREAMQKAIGFSQNMDYGDFESDEKTLFAVIRTLEIVGEAAKKVPHDIRKDFPRIPWREMSGMRDKLIHDYFGVDAKVVWRTVKEDLPGVAEELKKAISELSE